MKKSLLSLFVGFLGGAFLFTACGDLTQEVVNYAEKYKIFSVAFADQSAGSIERNALVGNWKGKLLSAEGTEPDGEFSISLNADGTFTCSATGTSSTVNRFQNLCAGEGSWDFPLRRGLRLTFSSKTGKTAQVMPVSYFDGTNIELIAQKDGGVSTLLGLSK